MHPMLRLLMILKISLISIGCLLSCLALSACHFPPRIYRIDVQQGNLITPEMLAKLKKGLTREQVKEIMGPPMLTHVLNSNRWDYYYYLKPGNGEPIKEKRVTVYFRGDTVSHWN